ncbi:MAG: glycosyltransferase family 4 protein [Candidatus Nanopelagicales bacterium]
MTAGSSTVPVPVPRPERSGQPLRVAFVTQWFPPEPVGLPLWIARSLAARGADVHVVTGQPNYPDGRIQEGHSAWGTGRDDRDGLRVTRSPLYPSHSTSALGRVANYLSFAGAASLAGRRVLRSADVVLVYGSPVTAAVPALASGTPYVLVAQDLWPDSVVATGYLDGDAAPVRLAARMSDELYSRAAHVVAITDGMRTALVDRGMPADHVSVVHNWVDETVLSPAAPDEGLRTAIGAADDDLVVLYAGTMGPAQGLSTAIEAVRLLGDRRDVHLALVGSGTERDALARQARDAGLDRVHLLDPVDVGRIPGLVAAADLNLVSLADEPLFRMTLPSKLQGTLACGGTVLGALAGDAAALVRESGAGFVVPPGDAAALAEALQRAAGTPRAELRAGGQAGRRFYETTLSEAVNAEKLMTLLTEHARPRKGERS